MALGEGRRRKTTGETSFGIVDCIIVITDKAAALNAVILSLVL